MVLQPQDPRLVVEPARQVGDLPERDAGQLRELLGGVLRRHADADDALVGGARVDRPHQRGHWVGVVVEPGAGRDLVQVARQAEQRRDRAEGPEDTPDAEGVRHRLPHAVPPGDLEVEPQALVPADPDHADHVIRSLERRPAVQIRLDRGRRTQCARGPSRDGRRGFEASGVGVEQRDRGPGQLPETEDVGQQLLGELGAARPVEHDLRHQAARWGRTCSAHRSSCAGDGSSVWRIRYSTPMAILSRSFPTISDGVPVR
jgi:hypothetical protein